MQASVMLHMSGTIPSYISLTVDDRTHGIFDVIPTVVMLLACIENS